MQDKFKYEKFTKVTQKQNFDVRPQFSRSIQLPNLHKQHQKKNVQHPNSFQKERLKRNLKPFKQRNTANNPSFQAQSLFDDDFQKVLRQIKEETLGVAKQIRRVSKNNSLHFKRQQSVKSVKIEVPKNGHQKSGVEKSNKQEIALNSKEKIRKQKIMSKYESLYQRINRQRDHSPAQPSRDDLDIKLIKDMQMYLKKHHKRVPSVVESILAQDALRQS